MPGHHVHTETVLANVCPTSSTSTSAIRALEETAAGVPCPGSEDDKFQSMSMVLYGLRFSKPCLLTAGVEGPAEQARDGRHREVA